MYQLPEETNNILTQQHLKNDWAICDLPTEFFLFMPVPSNFTNHMKNKRKLFSFYRGKIPLLSNTLSLIRTHFQCDSSSWTFFSTLYGTFNSIFQKMFSSLFLHFHTKCSFLTQLIQRYWNDKMHVNNISNKTVYFNFYDMKFCHWV